MASVGESYNPTLAEIARRVGRLEDRMDARVVSVDVYSAEKAAHTVEVAAMNHRLQQLENSLNAAVKLLVGAFLGIIGQAIFLAISFIGKN